MSHASYINIYNYYIYVIIAVLYVTGSYKSYHFFPKVNPDVRSIFWVLLEGFLHFFRPLLPGLQHLLCLGGTFPHTLQLGDLSTEVRGILFQLLNREVLPKQQCFFFFLCWWSSPHLLSCATNAGQQDF